MPKSRAFEDRRLQQNAIEESGKEAFRVGSQSRRASRMGGGCESKMGEGSREAAGGLLFSRQGSWWLTYPSPGATQRGWTARSGPSIYRALAETLSPLAGRLLHR